MFIEERFVIKTVDFILNEESYEDSSTVEVSVFLIVINLVHVIVFGYVFGDFDGVVNIGQGVSVLD